MGPWLPCQPLARELQQHETLVLAALSFHLSTLLLPVQPLQRHLVVSEVHDFFQDLSTQHPRPQPSLLEALALALELLSFDVVELNL